jgi:hypothetical protein
MRKVKEIDIAEKMRKNLIDALLIKRFHGDLTVDETLSKLTSKDRNVWMEVLFPGGNDEDTEENKTELLLKRFLKTVSNGDVIEFILTILEDKELLSKMKIVDDTNQYQNALVISQDNAIIEKHVKELSFWDLENNSYVQIVRKMADKEMIAIKLG